MNQRRNRGIIFGKKYFGGGEEKRIYRIILTGKSSLCRLDNKGLLTVILCLQMLEVELAASLEAFFVYQLQRVYCTSYPPLCLFAPQNTPSLHWVGVQIALPTATSGVSCLFTAHTHLPSPDPHTPIPTNETHRQAYTQSITRTHTRTQAHVR